MARGPDCLFGLTSSMTCCAAAVPELQVSESHTAHWKILAGSCAASSLVLCPLQRTLCRPVVLLVPTRVMLLQSFCNSNNRQQQQ